LKRLLVAWGRYALGQDQDGQHCWDAVQENVADLGDDHQSNWSWNGDDVGVKKVIQVVPACSASDFALVFDVLQQPSPHSFASGSLGGTRAHQYYEQIMDREAQ
jgi:hypothetical protein